MKAVQQIWPQAFAQYYRDQGYWTGQTFSTLLQERAQQLPEHTAVVGGDQRWSYAQLKRRADTAAAGFIALGLEPGERVVVQLNNIPEFLSVTFGLFRARLIPVFVLPAHRQTEIAHLAGNAEASALVVGPSPDDFDYVAMAREVQAEIPALQHIIAVGEARGAISFDGFEANTAALPENDADPSSVAFMQASGGSTGLSKLIPRTHDDYLYSCRASADICGLSETTVYLGALPVAHNFPMSSPGIMGTLCAGGRIVMSPTPNPETAFPLIERERVTITGLVPPLALLWLQAAAHNSADLSSLEVLQVGGSKLTPEAARRVRPVLGCTLQQVFGMAEGLVNYTRFDDPEEQIIATQGRPISTDDEILIVDDDDKPVAAGTAGHLLTRGPYTIRAYHNEPAANAHSFTADGYYRTGDIVRMTPAGNLEVRGRAKDHINRAGEKVSAEEIEDHLLAHPNIFDAAVVGIPDDYLGERSCAFIIPAGDKPKSTRIKAWMRERGVAVFKVPDQIKFVDSFQTTAVGKTSRKELRAQLRAQLLAQEA